MFNNISKKFIFKKKLAYSKGHSEILFKPNSKKKNRNVKKYIISATTI